MFRDESLLLLPCHVPCADAITRYHYGKFAAARANEAAKLDIDEEVAQPLTDDSKSQAMQQDGYRTRGSWSGKDADAK